LDLAVILTYRCSSKCSMCYVWQNPTLPEAEVGLPVLEKIPHGISYLNLTGGEPTLRRDLGEIVDLLYPRAMTLEISSNGTNPERLEPIIRKYPNVKIRFSLDGMGEVNDRVRGEKGGFDRKLQGLLRLKEIGGCDLGFAMTVQDDNAYQLGMVFDLCQRHGFELATSTLHNGFQFHKGDNAPYDRAAVAHEIQGLAGQMLRTANVKNWFRAYLNLGLMRKVLGEPRLLPCTAATDFAFVDPWSDVYACNVRPDLKLGNLKQKDWAEIMDSPPAHEMRRRVAACTHNCWMVGSAKTAMRNPRFVQLPRLAPLLWVVENKMRAHAGLPIRSGLEHRMTHFHRDPAAPHRPFFLDTAVPRRAHSVSKADYDTFGPFENR